MATKKTGTSLFKHNFQKTDLSWHCTFHVDIFIYKSTENLKLWIIYSSKNTNFIWNDLGLPFVFQWWNHIKEQIMIKYKILMRLYCTLSKVEDFFLNKSSLVCTDIGICKDFIELTGPCQYLVIAWSALKFAYIQYSVRFLHFEHCSSFLWLYQLPQSGLCISPWKVWNTQSYTY